MSNIPDELMYSQEHEWVRGELSPGGDVTVGVTDYAAAALGDVVYVETPQVGDIVVAGDVCGELESTKAVSELYSPVSGEVTAVNDAVGSAPELVNDDAYGEGWLFKVKVSAPAKDLLTAEQYSAITD